MTKKVVIWVTEEQAYWLLNNLDDQADKDNCINKECSNCLDREDTQTAVIKAIRGYKLEKEGEKWQ